MNALREATHRIQKQLGFNLVCKHQGPEAVDWERDY